MGSKGANKSFDYNLIKILDAVILSGNAAMAAKKLRHYTGCRFSGVKAPAELLPGRTV